MNADDLEAMDVDDVQAADEEEEEDDDLQDKGEGEGEGEGDGDGDEGEGEGEGEGDEAAGPAAPRGGDDPVATKKRRTRKDSSMLKSFEHASSRPSLHDPSLPSLSLPALIAFAIALFSLRSRHCGRFFLETTLVSALLFLLEVAKLDTRRASGHLFSWCADFEILKTTIYREKTEGYFKLEGPGWSLVIPLLKCYLGRNPPNEEPQSDVHVGNSTIISRRHARIEYDFDKKRFTLRCESKNGLRLNGVPILPNHGAVPLESLDTIRIADVELVFLLPYKTAKQNNKNRAQAQRSAKKYQELREKRQALGEDVGPPPKNAFNIVPPPNVISWAEVRRSHAPSEQEDSDDSDSDDDDFPTVESNLITLLQDMRPPPTSKRRIDKGTTVFKDDDSEDLEFERLSTKRTGAANRLERRAVSMEGWSEERKAMWTSNQLEINPEPYYFEYNEPGEVDAHGPWTSREESLFWARFRERGVDGWWGTFSMAIPGRTGRQCKEFYESLVAQGKVIDDRYVIEDGKAVQVRNENMKKPHRPKKSDSTPVSPSAEKSPPPEKAVSDLESNDMKDEKEPGDQAPAENEIADDPMQVDSEHPKS